MIGYGVARIDLLQSTMVRVFEAELDIPVIWGRSNVSRPPRPFARFDLISGPTRIQVAHEVRVITTESAYILDVPALPVSGSDYLIRANGVPYRHTSPVGETATTLRDSLIGLVNADREPATATVESALQLRVSESFPGSLPYFGVGGLLGQSIAGDSVQQCAKVHHARSEVTFGVQIFGQTNAVGTARSAGDLIAMVSMILDLDRSRLVFADQRITVNDIAGPTDISDLEGGGASNESRQTMDFAATITSMYAEVVPVIETVEAELVVGSTVVPIDITTPAP